MDTLTKTTWEILNATADDWENLESIMNMVGHEARENNGRAEIAESPNLQSVADGVRDLVEAGMLEARLECGDAVPPHAADLSYVWRGWFRMTPEGREIWNQFPHTSGTEN